VLYIWPIVTVCMVFSISAYGIYVRILLAIRSRIQMHLSYFATSIWMPRNLQLFLVLKL